MGNVGRGAVCLMITAAPGITHVTNPQPFGGGVDPEEDEALRTRLLHSYANISNGTNAAFYYDLAMSHEGVLFARVLPRRRSRGTVDVVISCADPAREAEAAAEIQALLAREKEINVDVAVYPAVRDFHPVNLAVELLPGADQAIVLERCAERIREFVDSLGVGEPLLRSRLGKILLEVEGVYNYRLDSPAADLLPEEERVIRCGEITVERLVGA